MDFLKIRKKARERAASRDAASPPAPAGAAAPAADADPPREAAEELESALAERLARPPALDEGFTTWRPGFDPAPRTVEPLLPPQAYVPPEPRSEDFALVTHGEARPALVTAIPASAPPLPAHVARAPLDEFFYRTDEETPELPAVGDPPEPEPAADLESAVREEYLTFLLGREEYAIAIERVREVVKAPPITEVPRAPAHILGVVTVRGEIVAVVDPRRRLGLPGEPPAGGAARIVIVDAGDGPCALLVDAVASVVRLPPGAIEPCPQGIAGARAEYLAGIGREGDRLFTLLDLGALFRRGPASAARKDGEARHARP
jgi:purine-binding chemotaxis protein CheW